MTTLTGVISYPIPAYSNVPIKPQFYQPTIFFILAISRGINTTVTTTADHNYVIGQEIRLLIPASFGAWQLNGQTGFVLSIPSPDQVIVNINSKNSNAFIGHLAPTQAQIIAIGDVNTGVQNSNGRSSTGTFIPGSFINISPN